MSNLVFIETIGLLAQKNRVDSQVLPSLTIAQGILESGWGKSGLTINANNLFGMKVNSSWTGKVYETETKECYNGEFTTVTACFKAYDDWEQSVADHSSLFSANRYANVVGETDYKKVCYAVKEAGYATDPDYPAKLIGIIEQYQLYTYDVQQETEEEMRIQTVDDCPDWAKDTIQEMVDQKELAGNGEGLDLSLDMIRTFVIVKNMLGNVGVSPQTPPTFL